jgi:hypothetical protein
MGGCLVVSHQTTDNTEGDDVDVAQERARIESSNGSKDVVRAVHLSKVGPGP